jgi:hypothetical protein
MYIAETGWPTVEWSLQRIYVLFLMIVPQKSSDAGNANNGASDASVAGLQTFMDTFVCQANTAGIPYFFFEVIFLMVLSYYLLTNSLLSSSTKSGRSVVAIFLRQ